MKFKQKYDLSATRGSLCECPGFFYTAFCQYFEILTKRLRRGRGGSRQQRIDGMNFSGTITDTLGVHGLPFFILETRFMKGENAMIDTLDKTLTFLCNVGEAIAVIAEAGKKVVALFRD